MADKTSDDIPMPPGGEEHFANAMLATLGAAKGTDCQLPQHICFVCGESKTKDGAALMVCGNCGSARYCSRECQKQAWKEHKKFCNFIKQGKELKEKAKQAPQSMGPDADEKSASNDEEPSKLRKMIDQASPAMIASEEYLEQATGMPSMLTLMRMMEQELKGKK